jgi:hypothetical protein
MGLWLAKHWWLLWALFAATGWVVYRLSRRGGDEPFLRRVMYALFPGTDPEGPRWLGVTTLSFIILAAGLVLIVVAYAIVKIVNN